MTNQKMIVLILPLILNRNFKDNIKAFKGFIIPVVIMFIYLLANNVLNYFVDYTLLGLFDFGNSNIDCEPLPLIIELIIIASLIYKCIKTKNINYLYCLCFQVIALPILDMQHVALALIPFIFFTCHCNEKTTKIINIVIALFIIIVAGAYFWQLISKDNYYLNKDTKSNYYLTIGDENVDSIDNFIKTYYYDNIDDYDIYFIYNYIYYYKLKNDIPINKFDLSLTGNSGYNGNEKLKKEIKKMNNTLFIVHLYDENDRVPPQANYDLTNYITTNYEYVESLGNNFYVYKIENDTN